MRKASAWHLYRNYVFLIPLFCCVLLSQASDFYAVARSCFGTRPTPENVFINDGPIVKTVLTNNAGRLRVGDRVLAINGVPFTSERVLVDQLRDETPGQPLHLRVQHVGASSPETVSVQLKFHTAAERSLWETAIRIAFEVMLASCALLGIYVAAVLPFDARALIVFGVMACTAQMVTVGSLLDIPPPLFDFAFLFNIVAVSTWGLWLALFGLYFPHRFEWDVAHPWRKWIVIGPLLLATIGAIAKEVRLHVVFDRFPNVPALDGRVLAAILIAFFFACLGFKRTGVDADARRRMRVLFAGAMAGLIPVGLFMLTISVLNVPPTGALFAAAVVTVAFLFFLFPAALAYVVLADRAMNVRMVVRQSVRYALAKGGLRLAFGGLVAFCITALVHFLGPALNGATTILLVVAGAIVLSRLGVRVRGRLQNWIDRKFFREAYDAERVLEELSDTVATIVQENELLTTVTRRIAETLHVHSLSVLVHKDGAYRPVCSVGPALPPNLFIPAESETVKMLTEANEPARVYAERRDNWIHTVPTTELVTLKQINAQLLLPLGLKDKLLGILSLGPKLSEEPYSRTDVHLLKSVMAQTALAMENSRLAAAIATETAQRERINREIEIAREVQERLFPQQAPMIAGIDCNGACRPAQGVGGDYYDFLSLANGDLGVAIGDVSGKGIAAALLMASLQACLRGQVMANQGDLARLMSNINQLVYEATPVNRYATFFYGQYSRETRTFTYVNAGHNPPVVLRRSQDDAIHVIRLETGGPVVGLFPHVPYQQGTLTLEPGDILVGFTDGISEAMNNSEQEWGEARLIPAIAEHSCKPVIEMLPALMRDADAFVDGALQHDDMTLVIMKLVPAA